MLYNTENPHGGDIYEGDIDLDFSANVNPFGMPEGVKRAIVSCIGELHRYPDPYCRELVSALAGYEDVPKEYLLCGAGAAELIFSWCAAAAPRKAMELAPTFSEYSAALERAGCEVVRHYLDPENGFAVTDALIDGLKREKPDALFVCDPNNPTGRAMAPELKRALTAYCRKNGVRVFADECFMDLADEPYSLVPELPSFRGLTVLKAFTKSFGMAGVRLGYCMSSDGELLKEMSKSVQPWNVSTVAQRAGTAALKESGFIETTRSHIKNERPRFAAELEAAGLAVHPSNANFLLVKGPEDLGAKLRSRRAAIRDCSNFRGLGKGFYRIAVRTTEENDRLLALIREITKGV